MSIGRLIKKVTSILMIVAMVMTSAGVHTLANSFDAVVEMANDAAEASENVDASYASVEDDEANVEESETSDEEPEEDETTAYENEEDGNANVEESETSDEEPEEETTEAEELEEETTETEKPEEETTVAEEETTVEETTADVEETATEESESVSEDSLDDVKEIVASASDILLGTDTIILTYNFNDKSNGGTGSTDVVVEDESKVAESKVVEKGKPYGKFDEDIFFWREGYTLLGWSFERDGEVIKETDIVDITENTTIYARWEKRKYKFRVSENLYIKGEKSKGTEYIEFAFDENIIKTIEENGIVAPTKDTDPEIYDCLEFLGWGFNGETENIVKDTDTYTDVRLIYENAHEPYLMAIYDIVSVHVKLNANDLGYYLDEGAEDIEQNRKKILDLGLVPPGIRLNEVEGYREPIPFKDMRFEKWWRPLIPEAPYEPTYKGFTIAPGGRIGSIRVNKEVAEICWNEEYKAHYEEDRYPIKLISGGTFRVIIEDVNVPATDTGVFIDDPSKFVFTDRLGKTKGGGSGDTRIIYALKGKNLKEALEEAGFEAPVAYDRDFLGWHPGERHPARVYGKYEDEKTGEPFVPVDFSKITIDGPMAFVAVWKKKPLTLIFKKGPNMKFESGREEFTIEYPARDIKKGDYIDVDAYEGSLYDCEGYEDPICLNNDGEVDDYNYEFRRWEDDEALLEDKIKFDTLFIPPGIGAEPIAWQEDKQKYKGLERAKLFDDKLFDMMFRDRGQKVFENGEIFYVDENGKKYADYSYGGDPYRAEPYVFTPVVDRIQMLVSMFSPFPVFVRGERRTDLIIGSGVNIGQVDEFVNADFSEVEKQGYHFAGWYQIDDEKVNKTLLDFGGPTALSVDDMEEYFNKGKPTILGMGKPGLDTWFKYVQCTLTDDLHLAAGQWFKKIDGDFVINRDTALRWDPFNRSKISVEPKAGVDIIALFSAHLTLDAGDGKFSDGSSEKFIRDILIDTITPIRDYVGAGYEVPTPNDDSKVFAGWRLVDAEGNDVRFFGDYEGISKDTHLVASYMDKQDIVTLTIDLHGAETVEDTGEVDEDGNKIYNVVEMQPIVMTLPQGIKMDEVEKDFPVVKRKGYKYSPIITLDAAWYYEYDNGEYNIPVTREDKILEDTTIHLKWSKERFSYDFIYEIDGEEKGYASIVGEYGQALKDTEFYKFAQVKNMFDFSLENQPEKGYMITSINKYNKNGEVVSPDTLIDGNVRNRLTVVPMDTTITFDANGGELVGENTLTVPYATYYKDIKDIVPKASKSELAFVGWIDDKGAQVTDEYRVATSYDEDKVKQAKFTAEWTDIKIAVTFDAGDGKFSNGTNKLSFENVPYMQVLSSIKEDDKAYEEPTLANKVFDRWEVILTKQYHNTEYTKDNKFGEKINYLEEEIKSVIVLKALYVDKTVTFSIKLHDPNQFTSAMTFVYLPREKERIVPHDYVFKLSDMIGFHSHYHSGGTYVQTVKEGMTFGQWFDYMYDEGYRYRTENGYLLCGWKYEEPASIEAPRKKTFNMKDVDMDAPIKNGDVFTPLMAKGSFTVKIDANGGYYKDLITDKETSTGVRIHQEYIDLVTYENVPAGTRSDKIDGIYLPVRPGYTLTGYSRYKDVSEKSLASSVFVAGDEYLYAIWSKNGNQVVQPTVQMRDNSNSGGSGTGGVGPIQNANDPRIGVVEGVGPQSGLPADAPKEFVQNISAVESQQTQAQVTQLMANAGITGEVANSTEVQQAAAEVQAGMNIMEQYGKLAAQIAANPSITTESAKISNIKIEAKDAYWHTDANGNVTLASTRGVGYVKDVWQPVTNDAGQTGWYKFDANGHMQTGLVQDGNCTYYLSEERGAGYGQMVCNQTINIGGLSMTFNASGALVDMQYSAEAAVKTLQDAVASAFVGPPVPAGPANQNQVGPATFLSTQPVGPGL